jgi:hypothetical protein
LSVTKSICFVTVTGYLVLSACSTPPDPRRTNFEVRKDNVYAKYDPKSGRLQKIDVDQNKNGRMDTFSYWDGTRIHRIEIDKDEDGKIDSWEHYSDNNKLERVGSSTKDDEVEDAWTYPDDKGFLGRVETDTDRDGVIDKREIFVARPESPEGRYLSVVELEIDKTGQPARRLYYGPGGTFKKSEVLR